ncbi:MAG: HupE/UreJ family protein [Rubrivivax sp.]|jgi:urease accessory protein|nr:HupE/UreJ family protein [Rubrivivax sp.]
MIPIKPMRRVVAALPLLAAGAALAHTGHAPHDMGFIAGLVHPPGGLDHLLAMIAVGLWAAAALPAGRRWIAPAVFVGTMALFAVAAQSGIVPPAGRAFEILIAGSVALLGWIVVAGARVAPVAGLATIVAAAQLHGAAHGLEFQGSGDFAAYAAGFTLSTALLHAIGLFAGTSLLRLRGWLPRLAGAGIGAGGLALMVARL